MQPMPLFLIHRPGADTHACVEIRPRPERGTDVISRLGPQAQRLLERMREVSDGELDAVQPVADALSAAGSLMMALHHSSSHAPEGNEVPDDPERSSVWCLLAHGSNHRNVECCLIVPLDRTKVLDGPYERLRGMTYLQERNATPAERALQQDVRGVEIATMAESGKPFFLIDALPDDVDRLLRDLHVKPSKQDLLRLLLAAMEETALTCIRHGRG